MATITQTELIAAGGYLNFGQPAALAFTGPRTVMMYGKITGAQNPGYLFSKGLATGYGGPRLQISTTNKYLQLVTPTAASNLAPAKSSVANSVDYAAWANWASTWDGASPCDTQAKIFKDGVEDTTGPVSTGSTPYADGSGNDFFLWNRPDFARSPLGSFAYFAIWNRELSATEIADVVANGPLSVSDGLVLCWANGQDYSANALTPTARTVHADGELPPNTALGTLSVPASQNLASQNIAGTSVEITSPTASSAGAPASSLALVVDEDSMNAHPTSSTIDNSSTDTPTVNIKVRVVYSGWRQFYFKLTGASGKRPLFRVDPSSYVNAFNAAWKPWYSYDGITWFLFDAAPVNNTTSWDFQLSTAFTGDTVYVGFQPAYPVWRATTWLISQLQGINSALIHELASAPSFHSASKIPDQTNELGATVPGQYQYGFGIWDNAKAPADGSAKRLAVLTGGMHAGEHVGNWALEGFLRFLLGGSAKATTLLQNFKFLVYPCINPMGRYMGHYRMQRDPANLTLDPNRDWPITDGTASILTSSTILRGMFATDIGAGKLAFHMDFHGTWGSSSTGNFWYYGDVTDARVGYGDPNALYTDEWAARVHAYKAYVADLNTVLPDTTLRGWMSRNYGAYHDYISENYEQSAYPGGISDLTTVGETYAQALADTPLSELRLSSDSVTPVAADIIIGAPVLSTPSLSMSSPVTSSLIAQDITAGIPYAALASLGLSSPSIAELECPGIIIGAAVIGSPSLYGPGSTINPDDVCDVASMSSHGNNLHAFSQKDPRETYPVEFRFPMFSDDVVSAIFDVTLVSGADASPNNMLFEKYQIGGISVFQRITGGLSGCKYKIRCEATDGIDTYVQAATVEVSTI